MLTNHKHLQKNEKLLTYNSPSFNVTWFAFTNDMFINSKVRYYGGGEKLYDSEYRYFFMRENYYPKSNVSFYDIRSVGDLTIVDIDDVVRFNYTFVDLVEFFELLTTTIDYVDDGLIGEITWNTIMNNNFLLKQLECIRQCYFDEVLNKKLIEIGHEYDLNKNYNSFMKFNKHFK